MVSIKRIIILAMLFVLPLLSGTASGAGPVPSTTPYILGVPPRGTDSAQRKVYDPIARYLSQVLGKPVVFKPAGSWGVYQGLMTQGYYDLDIDGPQFTGWRVQHMHYTVLTRVGGHLTMAVIVRTHSTAQKLSDLAGETACASAPPWLGTLVLQSLFGAARQPYIVEVNGLPRIYHALLARKCTMAVLPMQFLRAQPDAASRVRLVYQYTSMPNVALSAGPRISTADREKIIQAVLAPQSDGPFRMFANTYMHGKPWLPATDQQYALYGLLLQNQFGFGFGLDTASR